jgi:hypothetical protein
MAKISLTYNMNTDHLNNSRAPGTNERHPESKQKAHRHHFKLREEVVSQGVRRFNFLEMTVQTHTE